MSRSRRRATHSRLARQRAARMRRSTRSMTSSGVDVPAVMPTVSAASEPFRTKIRLGLDVMDARTMAAARVHQLTRVVAVRAADDDDDVASARQLDGGVLPLLRRLADRVDEADVGLRESPSNQRDQVPHPLDRLRRLRGDADARMRARAPARRPRPARRRSRRGLRSAPAPPRDRAGR